MPESPFDFDDEIPGDYRNKPSPIRSDASQTGLSVASLVTGSLGTMLAAGAASVALFGTGLTASCLCCAPFGCAIGGAGYSGIAVSSVLGFAAIIFGCIGMRHGRGRAMAAAGMSLGALAMFIGIIPIIATLIFGAAGAALIAAPVAVLPERQPQVAAASKARERKNAPDKGEEERKVEAGRKALAERKAKADAAWSEKADAIRKAEEKTKRRAKAEAEAEAKNNANRVAYDVEMARLTAEHEERLEKFDADRQAYQKKTLPEYEKAKSEYAARKKLVDASQAGRVGINKAFREIAIRRYREIMKLHPGTQAAKDAQKDLDVILKGGYVAVRESPPPAPARPKAPVRPAQPKYPSAPAPVAVVYPPEPEEIAAAAAARKTDEARKKAEATAEKVTRTNYSKIREGMTLAEVQAILGAGRENASADGILIVMWQSNDFFFRTIISVTFVNNRVQAKAIVP